MISTDIAEFFNNYPHLKRYFLGIFNVDTIRRNIPVNHFLICNTDSSSGPGQHWFVLFRYSVSELECFDSLGVGDDRQTFLRSVKFRGIRELHYNQSPVQLPTSTTCGHFCLVTLVVSCSRLEEFHIVSKIAKYLLEGIE